MADDLDRLIERARAAELLRSLSADPLDMGQPVAPEPAQQVPPLVPAGPIGGSPYPIPDGWDVRAPEGQGIEHQGTAIGPGLPTGEDTAAWLNRAGEAMTLGLVGDEAAAFADSLIGRGSYDDRLQFYRDQAANMLPAAQVSADLVGSVIPALLGAGAVSGAQTLLGRMGVGAGLGAGAGSTYGFMTGEGGFGDRAIDALVGGGIGGALGGALPVASGVAGNLAARGSQVLRDRRIGTQVARGLDVKPQTGAAMAELTYGLDPRDMAQNLGRAGPDAMLADAAPSLGQALSYSVNTPNPGSALAVQRVGDRAAGARQPVIDALSGGSERSSVGAAINAARGETQLAIRDAYRRAYTSPIDYSSAAGREVESVFNSIPDRIIEPAVRRANEMMQWEMDRGRLPRDIRQIMFRVGDDGSVVWDELPNVAHLDYIKRALDETVEASRDSITRRLSPEGRLVADMSRELRNATRDAVPAYGEALNIASDAFGTENAIRFGSDLLSPRTTTFDAVEHITRATDAERAAMRIGVAEDLREALGNVYAVASDLNVDARQASAMVRRFTSENAQDKLSALFGDQWPAMRQQIDQAVAAVNLRSMIARNSITRGATAFDEMVTSQNTPGALVQGRPVAALRDTLSEVAGASPEAIRRASGETKAEIADLLTRGGQADDILSVVARALAENPARPNVDRDFRNIVNALGFTGLPSASAMSTSAVRGQ